MNPSPDDVATAIAVLIVFGSLVSVAWSLHYRVSKTERELNVHRIAFNTMIDRFYQKEEDFGRAVDALLTIIEASNLPEETKKSAARSAEVWTKGKRKIIVPEIDRFPSGPGDSYSGPATAGKDRL